MKDTFKPKILAFLCNWCSYAGADLAGVSRIQYPSTIRVVRVMCSGRVDPVFIINALKEGFDGVLVSGCHIGDCHYQTGNLYTLKRMNTLSKLFDMAGIGKNRVFLRWASAAEAQIFADNVVEITNEIKKLGPFDRSHNELALNALEKTFSSARLRWLIGIDRQITETENVYKEKTDPDYFKKILQSAVEEEFYHALIIEVLGKGPISIRQMAKQTGLPVHTVSCRLNDLELEGLAEIAYVEGTTPKFVNAT